MIERICHQSNGLEGIRTNPRRVQIEPNGDGDLGLAVKLLKYGRTVDAFST